MVTPGNRSRGQLILIGALMLATVILGLSVLLNSILFTGAAGDTGAAAALEETGHVDYDVERGARQLVVRINHDERNRSAAEIGDAVDTNVGNFSQALAEARARSSSVAVSVDYDNSSSTFGRRIVQDHLAGMTDGSGSPTWEPVPDTTPPTRVGWFSLNVDVANVSANPFTVTAENESGHEVRIRLQQTASGSELRVRSDATYPGAPAPVDVTCDPERGRVLLDLYSGRVFTSDCTFTGIGSLDRPSSITFERGNRLRGKYAIVVNRSNPDVGTSGTYYRCRDPVTGNGRPPSQADPCVAPAVWAANITTAVEGPTLSYQDTYNLTVYTNNR
jgi:hypothetical protein